MNRSGYRNGILIYPVSVVDHMKLSCSDMEKDVKELKQWMEEETTQVTFWIGGGSDASDIMDDTHKVQTDISMKKSVDIVCEDDDHILVVMSSDKAKYFVRIDLNGYEIPITATTETIDEKTYTVLTSTNTYSAGTYNIDINS